MESIYFFAVVQFSWSHVSFLTHDLYPEWIVKYSHYLFKRMNIIPIHKLINNWQVEQSPSFSTASNSNRFHCILLTCWQALKIKSFVTQNSTSWRFCNKISQNFWNLLLQYLELNLKGWKCVEFHSLLYATTICNKIVSSSTSIWFLPVVSVLIFLFSIYSQAGEFLQH